jgi:uncharacterized damage-inducible protein DinB
VRPTIASIEGEFRRYKKLAEDAIAQLDDAQLFERSAPSNSIATIVWHIAGNFASRFTDFLTTDGEKPWRDRDSEFVEHHVSRAELLAKWDAGWRTLFGALASLSDDDLQKGVTIRNQPLTVVEALHRSLAHGAYHVGQILYVAKALRGTEWKYLSIPPGKSADANKNPGAYPARAPSR